MEKYKITIGLKKGIIGALIFGIPFLVTSFPEYANITLGGLGIMLVNFLKMKYKNKPLDIKYD